MSRSSPQPDSPSLPLPRVDVVVPAAALPQGEVELAGIHLGPHEFGVPAIYVDGDRAHLLMSRPARLAFRVPASASTGIIEVRTPAGAANAGAVHIAHKLADSLHPVTNPAVSRSGMIYTTISGPRGKMTSVSVMRISADGRATPFVTGLLNATGLAFSPAGDLYVTSRAEGSVYRVDAAGEFTKYVEGMGVATGAVFDAEGNLFVGDRSGTIFKINPERQIFVHATLEPSVSAYHLAVNPEGTLFVTAPTLSSNEAIWAIEPNGDTRVWYRGLGRPQGLALARNGDIYLAACLHGRHGLVRVTPHGEASLAVAGDNLVGLAFSPLGATILATNEAVYDVDLGVEGLNLF